VKQTLTNALPVPLAVKPASNLENQAATPAILLTTKISTQPPVVIILALTVNTSMAQSLTSVFGAIVSAPSVKPQPITAPNADPTTFYRMFQTDAC